jgi:hypothetical protein
MEIDMAKRRMETKISLDEWDLPKLSNKIEDITDKTRNKIEKALDEFADSFYEKKIESLIKSTVSEFLQYASKDSYFFDFCPRKGKPGDVHFHVCFSDYDYTSIETSLRAELTSAIKGWLEADGYIAASQEEYFLALAAEYRNLDKMIHKKIRPKGKS